MSDPDKEIMERVLSLQNKLSYIWLEYASRKSKINKKILDLQNACPHNETKYHSDPSGNNDSFHSCQVCGKEAKKL